MENIPWLPDIIENIEKATGRTVEVALPKNIPLPNKLDYDWFFTRYFQLIDNNNAPKNLAFDFGSLGRVEYFFSHQNMVVLTMHQVRTPDIQFNAAGWNLVKFRMEGQFLDQYSFKDHFNDGFDCCLVNEAAAAEGWKFMRKPQTPVSAVLLFFKEALFRTKKDLNRDVRINHLLDNKQPALYNGSPTSAMLTSLMKLYRQRITDFKSELLFFADSLTLLAQTLDAIANDINSGTVNINQRNIAAIEKIRGYIDNNLELTLTIEDLATIGGINRRKLSEGFRKMFDTSVHEYVLYKRMQSATMLLTTKLTLSEVALKVGYANQSSFGRVFKSFFGVTPKKYRQKLEINR